MQGNADVRHDNSCWFRAATCPLGTGACYLAGNLVSACQRLLGHTDMMANTATDGNTASQTK